MDQPCRNSYHYTISPFEMWKHKFVIFKNASKLLLKLLAKGATNFGNVPDWLRGLWYPYHAAYYVYVCKMKSWYGEAFRIIVRLWK